ncbi:MAG: flagellar basal body-associated FliL family protein [Thermodesulfovibrionales bacterium]
MAEEVQEPQEQAAEKPRKGSSLKLVIIIVAASVVLAGAAVGAYLFLAGGAEADTAGEQKAAPAEAETVLLPFEPFVVNLSAPGRYLKVTMQFEIKDPASQELVNRKTPVLRDAVITLLSSKSTEAVSGPEGKFQLKDEILFRVNQAMGKEVFKNIYFTEFVMQ